MFRRSATPFATMPPVSFTPKPWTGASRADIIAKRQKFLLPTYIPFYKEPLVFSQGHQQYLYDTDNNRYLDMYGCIVTVGCGHGHPRLAKVAHDAMTSIGHTSMAYVHNAVGDYAEALAAKLPDYQDWTIIPLNSGSEATDVAIIMSRTHTGNHQVFNIRNSYHGVTEGARGLVAMKGWKHPIPGPVGVTRAANPHTLRGVYGTKPEDLDKYLTDLENQIFEETPGKVAAMFIERIQGAGGAAPLIEGYQRRAFEIIKKYGGVCIADEVQGGFGRTGKKFWSFELDEAKPDIVNMAKSIANGFPMGVCAVKKEIAESMSGVNLVNTYGGNPVASAVGLETLKIIEEEKLMENCDKVGSFIKAGLEKLAQKYPQLAIVRGWGLILGMEFVAKPGSMEPGTALVGAIHERLKNDHQILIGKGGNFGSAMRIAPPMCLTQADAEYFLECFEDVLSKECVQ